MDSRGVVVIHGVDHVYFEYNNFYVIYRCQFFNLLSQFFVFFHLFLCYVHWSRFAGRWLSCAQPRQCPKILTLYQRKKEVCSVRSRGNPWQRSRLASPRKRPGRGSFSREERKARYEREPYAYDRVSSNFLRALTTSKHNSSRAYFVGEPLSSAK